MNWFLLHFFWYVSNMIANNGFTNTLPGGQEIGESKSHPAVCSSLWIGPCLSPSSHSIPQKFSEEEQWAL